LIGLDWIGLDWIGLDWIGLDWIGLDWIAVVRRSLIIIGLRSSVHGDRASRHVVDVDAHGVDQLVHHGDGEHGHERQYVVVPIALCVPAAKQDGDVGRPGVIHGHHLGRVCGWMD